MPEDKADKSASIPQIPHDWGILALCRAECGRLYDISLEKEPNGIALPLAPIFYPSRISLPQHSALSCI